MTGHLDREQRAVLWKQLEDSYPDTNPGEGYIPNAKQLEILDDQHPTQLVGAGERSGKSKTSAKRCLEVTLAFLAEHSDVAAGQVAWLVGQDYEKTRKEFEYLVEDFTILLGRAKVKASKAINPGQIELKLGKTWADGIFTIKTKSADQPQSLVAEPPVWILVCEAAQVEQPVYWRLRGRVGEARSRYPGYGLFHMSGSFEGSLGHYPKLWEKWQGKYFQIEDHAKSFSMKSEDNHVAWPGGHENPELIRLKQELPENVFAERHLGIPAPPGGLVHRSFSVDVHVQPVEYDPELPVGLAIDPGYSGKPSVYAVVALQKQEGQWRAFDEVAEEGLLMEEVIEVVRGRSWWGESNKKGLIHGVIDTSGARHADARESNWEGWLKETGLVLRHQPILIQPGIDKMNTMLKVDPITGYPRFIMDPKCPKLISEFGGQGSPMKSRKGETHVYQWKMTNENEVVGKVPEDRNNDSIKACTYFFYNEEGPVHTNTNRRTIRVKSRRRRKLAMA